MSYPFVNYRVLFTVLENDNTYGATIDVTQDIDLSDFISSFGSIKREVDNGDYDFGIFTFGNLTMNAINFDRKFNTEHDALSVFPYLRDRTKVEIEFRDENDTAKSRFKGLINDDATRQNIESNSVRFVVSSLDSILRQVKVPPGAIPSGDTFQTAIRKILNVPEITSVMTYVEGNITPALNLTIDDGEVFSSVSASDALNNLLLASNSILYIDSTDTVFVKPRTVGGATYNLYGRGDMYGRDNILNIKSYNNGLHRARSSLKVNSDTVVTSDPWVSYYGFRQKSVSFDFITNTEKKEQIGQALLDEFKVPKSEMEVEVLTKDVEDIELLDTVKVNFPYQVFPTEESVPLCGQVTTPFNLPKTVGSIRILPIVKWKVIGIDERPRSFTTTLKLRQAGTQSHDGVFS